MPHIVGLGNSISTLETSQTSIVAHIRTSTISARKQAILDDVEVRKTA